MTIPAPTLGNAPEIAGSILAAAAPAYYEDSAVTIYHGDSRQILPTLPVPELIVTDPPYGMDYQSCRRTECQRKPKIQGDIEFPEWILDARCSVAMFLFCRWDNLPHLPNPNRSLFGINVNIPWATLITNTAASGKRSRFTQK